ncbi:MAG: ribonuclease P protein component [Candidatus Terrybacteria bacterium]|nr:ribonuclease P protein component [Candidatus Terrybacteria bacterium]
MADRREGPADMIPKRFRGIPPTELGALFRFGKRRRFSYGQIVLRNRQQGVSRLAVVVPARVAKKAIARTRIRRAIQAALLPLLPALRPALDIAVVWEQGTTPPHPAALSQELGALLHSPYPRGERQRP